jgi:hypothetical protein
MINSLEHMSTGPYYMSGSCPDRLPFAVRPYFAAAETRHSDVATLFPEPQICN